MKFLYLLLFFFFSLNISAQESGFSYGTTLASKYLWRGTTPTKEPVVQPFVEYQLAENHITFNLWASFAISDRTVSKSADEVDFTASYAFEAGISHIELGTIIYKILNNSDADTEEIFAHAEFHTFLNPFLGAFYDLQSKKAYIEPGISYDLSLLNLKSALGMDEEFSLKDVLFSASYEFEMESFSISPFANYVLAHLDTDHKENIFNAGIDIAF